MLVPLYIDGKLVYKRKSINEICDYAQKELNSLWEEYRRLKRPQLYKVDLSQKLWDLKNKMIENCNINCMKEE